MPTVLTGGTSLTSGGSDLNVVLNNPGTTTISTPITGGIGLTRAGVGGGTLVLTGASSYTGATSNGHGRHAATGDGATDASIGGTSGVVNAGTIRYNLQGNQNPALRHPRHNRCDQQDRPGHACPRTRGKHGGQPLCQQRHADAWQRVGHERQQQFLRRPGQTATTAS